jgi:hypothetical protein
MELSQKCLSRHTVLRWWPVVCAPVNHIEGGASTDSLSRVTTTNVCKMSQKVKSS